MRPTLAVLGLSSLLIGCSIHPLPDDVSRKTTYDIVEKIRCEAKAAVEEFGRGFANASIVYNFTFNINEHNDAAAGFTFLEPFKAAGTSVNLVASGTSNRTREGIRNFELIELVRRPAQDELHARPGSELDIPAHGGRGYV